MLKNSLGPRNVRYFENDSFLHEMKVKSEVVTSKKRAKMMWEDNSLILAYFLRLHATFLFRFLKRWLVCLTFLPDYTYSNHDDLFP